MNAAKYRARAEEILTARHVGGVIPDHKLREADVWARLAQSAARSESTAAATTDSNTDQD